MVLGHFFLSGSEPEETYALRDEIFAAARDEYDNMAIFALAQNGEDAYCACGRLCVRDDDFTIEYLGVREPLRGMGYGDLIARMLLYKAQEMGAARVRLSCEPSVAPFFARYGFRADGDGMVVSGEKICLQGKCARGGVCGGDCESCGAGEAK